MINFVYYLSKPVIIRNEEIEAIIMFLNNSENVRLDKSTVDFQVRVRETDGAYINMQGDVMELVNKTIFVILPSLGYNLVTEIKGNQIKVVTTQERQMAIR